MASECDLRVSESKVDFGRISRPSSRVLNASDGLQALSPRSISLSVHCAEPSALMLSLQGEAQRGHFRFSGQGHVVFTLSGALLDGRPVQLARSTVDGAAGAYGPSVEVAPGDNIVPTIGGLPVSGTVWSMVVEISPLVSLADLRTADAKSLEARTEFEIRQR